MIYSIRKVAMVSTVPPFPEYRSQDVTVLTFNLTWNCPVRCSYCYRTLSVSRGHKKILSKEDLIRECHIAKEYGIREYRFSGGEPIVIGDTLFEYADMVYEITGYKPVVMTSGYGIDDTWLKKARNKFTGVAISVENPLAPLQTVVNNRNILDLIRMNT
ncbi:MAG: radical SAM protein, partial [Taibaiella sp.]|nr:radical SAM protein [Taibaiella sp.]